MTLRKKDQVIMRAFNAARSAFRNSLRKKLAEDIAYDRAELVAMEVFERSDEWWAFDRYQRASLMTEVLGQALIGAAIQSGGRR